MLDELQVDEAQRKQPEGGEHDRTSDAETDLEAPQIAFEIAEFAVAHRRVASPYEGARGAPPPTQPLRGASVLPEAREAMFRRPPLRREERGLL